MSVFGLGNLCTLGRPDLEVTSPNLTSGTYIDMTSPTSCGGQIKQWDYCYYNPRDFDINTSDFLVNFQVWRLSSARSGVVIGESVKFINIPPPTEGFLCNSIILSPDRYINVTEGDYLGIRISRNTFPVVANSIIPGSQLLFIPASLLIPKVIDSTTDVQIRISTVLHVTAEIGKNNSHGK